MVLLRVALLLAVWVADIRAQSSNDLPPMNYSHMVVLDQNNAFVMLWTPRENDIEIEIQVRKLT